ncbi:MAG: sugar phosphate isomerase/epimerase family protein [Phycisphaerae bacterium]
MKIGFSSLVCPGWDLSTIVSKAAEYGFDGVELRGIAGELRLTQVPELAGNPGVTRRLFDAAGVELVCLGTSSSLASRKPREVARHRAELDEHIELASKLGCPFVRVFVGDVQQGEARQRTLSRVSRELAKIADFAVQQKVTVLVHNNGDFSGSADMWYLCDSVDHPAIRVCWDPCAAMTLRERPTISIPRLGTKIGLVHVCDAEFDEMGFMVGGYKVPGTGHVELARAIELLNGVLYQDYLIFEWPKLWQPSLAAPDTVLPEVSRFLRERLDAKQAILSAYKGKDKKGPPFKPLPAKAIARPN